MSESDRPAVASASPPRGVSFRDELLKHWPVVLVLIAGAAAFYDLRSEAKTAASQLKAAEEQLRAMSEAQKGSQRREEENGKRIVELSEKLKAADAQCDKHRDWHAKWCIAAMNQCAPPSTSPSPRQRGLDPSKTSAGLSMLRATPQRRASRIPTARPDVPPPAGEPKRGTPAPVQSGVVRDFGI